MATKIQDPARCLPWRARVKRKGRKPAVQFFRTKKEAETWEALVKTGAFDPWAEETALTTHSTSLLEWNNAYLAFSLRKHSKKTFSEKRGAFRRLFAFINPDSPAEDLTRATALEHLGNQFDDRSGYAANKDRKNLAAAWKWARDFMDDFPPANVWRTVPKFPETRKPRYVPPEKDLFKVIEAATGQDRVMLLTLLYTAARKGEMFRMVWQDVDFAGKRLRLGTRKRADGSLEYEWLPMTDDLFATLLEHRKGAVNEWVFVQSVGRHSGKPYTENRGFPQEICEKVEAKPFGCHAIRHHTASTLWKLGVPLQMVQLILRHKSPRTTEKYLRKLIGDKELRPHLALLRGGKKIVGGTGGGTETTKAQGCDLGLSIVTS